MTPRYATRAKRCVRDLMCQVCEACFARPKPPFAIVRGGLPGQVWHQQIRALPRMPQWAPHRCKALGR